MLSKDFKEIELALIHLKEGKVIDEALLNQGRDRLLRRADALLDVTFSSPAERAFSFTKLREGFGRGELSKWIRPYLADRSKAPTIYRLTASSPAAVATLKAAYQDFDRSPGEAMAKDMGVSDSTTLYVGSSHDIATRLRQHLHTCHKGTYALKMHLWCPIGDHSVKVEVAKAANEVSPDQLQDIEDALWLRSRPIFGKFGPQ